MEKTNIMVEFCIIGDEFDPQEITKNLKIEPTECYIKGSRGDYGFKKKETCWSIDTGYIDTLYISEPFDYLLDRLINVKETIVKLKNNFGLDCKFFVVINIVQDMKPAIYLDKKILDFVNYVDAEIDFDLYIL